MLRSCGSLRTAARVPCFSHLSSPALQWHRRDRHVEDPTPTERRARFRKVSLGFTADCRLFACRKAQFRLQNRLNLEGQCAFHPAYGA